MLGCQRVGMMIDSVRFHLEHCHERDDLWHLPGLLVNDRVYSKSLCEVFSIFNHLSIIFTPTQGGTSSQMSLISAPATIRAVFALQVVVTVLAFLVFSIVASLTALLFIRRRSRQASQETSPRGTFAFLSIGVLCLAIAQAATAASVALQTNSSSRSKHHIREPQFPERFCFHRLDRLLERSSLAAFFARHCQWFGSRPAEPSLDYWKLAAAAGDDGDGVCFLGTCCVVLHC
jgi:hypothetical protein